jgi:3-hydroxybutyryl-CoA dehydrogenase
MATGSAKARIAVIGAGLMGHGIAQVFAVAGHDVTITDSFVQNLDTVKSRIAANLRDLGEDEGAVARVRTCADLGKAVRDADYVVEAVSGIWRSSRGFLPKSSATFVPTRSLPATPR